MTVHVQSVPLAPSASGSEFHVVKTVALFAYRSNGDDALALQCGKCVSSRNRACCEFRCCSTSLVRQLRVVAAP